MKSNKSYPELYYSDEVNKVLKSKPTLPQAPVEPKKPQAPVNPGEYDSGGNRGCFIVMLIAGIVGLIYVLSADIDGKFRMVLMCLVLIAIAFFMVKTTFWDEDSHKDKVRDYNDAVKNYPKLLAQWERDCDRYDEDKAEYDRKVRSMTSKEALMEYRKNKMKQLLNHRSVPNFSDCDVNVKKGVSESYFVDFLLEQGFCVYDEKKIPVGGTFYYPDILIVYNGIYVDVEIDEPYVGNDGTPIHYLENNHIICDSVDSERNDYICSEGFEVVRFAEEQVFLYPQKCADFLKNMLKSILNGDGEVDYPKEIIVSKWTKDQASKMAYQRYRNSYVPDEYKQFISTEGKWF